ncbi:MAG TPA: BBE domain-containing protein, partial [Halobacteriales archaeon]|nr:BBE domain-containing protein [Halobacteriales archaeon]
RAYGLSCDNLRSVELVTADGDFVTASAEENAALFWAIRGGGGGFGVVTTFEFDLHPVGPEVASCLVFYAADDLPEVLAGFRAYVADAPDAVSALTFSGELPEEALFDGETLRADKIAVLGCYAGPVEQGERALAPLRELAEPLADESGPIPYVELQRMLDADYPDGMRYYWKSLYLEGLSEAAIDRIAYWTDAAPSPLSTVDVWQLGGAIDRVDADASAFPARDAPFLLGVEANWEDPAADEANVRWVRECLDDMREFSDGSTYLNFPGFHEEGEEMLRTTFGSAYERLEGVKAEYDPAGLFDPGRSASPAIPTDD